MASSSLPAPAPSTPREGRHASYPLNARELQLHFRATQIAVCYQQILLTNAVVNLQVYPDSESDDMILYACLDVRSDQLPVLNNAVHITIGVFRITGRVFISHHMRRMQSGVDRHSPVVIQLEPYGRGGHWRLITGFFSYYLIAWLRTELENDASLEALWQPEFHITWRDL